MQNKYTISDTELVRIAQQVQPACAFDPQSLCNLANQIQSLADKICDMEEKINHVHKRVCVSNGEQSLIDAQREEKQWRREHIKDHDKLFGVGKFVIGLIVTLILALLPALYGLFTSSVKTQQIEKKINMLEEQIMAKSR